MAVNKIAKARTRGMMISCGAQVVALPVALTLLAAALFAANTLPYDTSPVIIVGGVIGVVLGGIVAPLMVMIFVVVRYRAWRLDPALASIGPGRQYSVVGRGWQGEVDGRQVNAWFSRGPQLEIYIEGDTGALAGVGQDNFIVRAAAGVTGHELVDLDGLFAGGPKIEWTKGWLAEPGVREALDVLLEEDDRSLRSIAVLPDSVRFVARFVSMAQVNEDNVERWLKATRTCLDAALKMGPHDPPAEPGFGSGLRTYRGGLWVGCVVVAGTLGVIAAVTGFVAVILAITGT